MATIVQAKAAVNVPILSSVLNEFMDTINSTIQQTINGTTDAVLSMEVEAGRQVAIAILNAKEAYADSLNLTMDRVNALITAKVDQLRNMVQIVQDNNKALLGQASADAQQLVDTLPFVSMQPYLKTIAPQYVAISSKQDTVLVKFSGKFPWVNDKRYPTTFKMNDQTCPIFKNTNQDLMFTVPVAVIPNTTVNKCTYVMGKLSVDWDSGWIFSHRHTAEYSVGLAVLPLSPGNITACYTSSSLKRVEKSYTSQTYRYDGNSWYPQSWKTINLTVPPEAGWRLDRQVPPKLVMHPGAHGNHTQGISSYDENGAQVAIGLDCSSGHYMGIIEFHLVFNEYQMVPESNSREELIVLKWGDSKIPRLNLGETIWKIVFNCFDGSSNDFGPADTGNKYLKLVNEGENIRLIAQVPDQIQL